MISEVKPDLAYEDVLGLKMFDCDRLSARLNTKSCAARWEKAQNPENGFEAERLSQCKDCIIGAMHAGKDYVKYSRFYGMRLCSSCGNGATRILSGSLCVSCYNRRREMKIGKNARGNFPSRLMSERPLRSIHVRVERNGVASSSVHSGVVDAREAILRTLTSITGHVRFAAAGAVVNQTQLDLFA